MRTVPAFLKSSLQVKSLSAKSTVAFSFTVRDFMLASAEKVSMYGIAVFDTPFRIVISLVPSVLLGAFSSLSKGIVPSSSIAQFVGSLQEVLAAPIQ